jgi:hypothetical protein
MPWGFWFEMHGWWHVLTCVGAYTCKSFPIEEKVRAPGGMEDARV